LPFPNFEESLLREKEDALDYPPEGSPDYKPPVVSPEPAPVSQTAPLAKPKGAGRLFDFRGKRP
jgi:hypothetical protein